MKQKTGVSIDQDLFDDIEDWRISDQTHPDFQNRSQAINECARLGLDVIQTFEDFGRSVDDETLTECIRFALKMQEAGGRE